MAIVLYNHYKTKLKSIIFGYIIENARLFSMHYLNTNISQNEVSISNYIQCLILRQKSLIMRLKIIS